MALKREGDYKFKPSPNPSLKREGDYKTLPPQFLGDWASLKREGD